MGLSDEENNFYEINSDEENEYDYLPQIEKEDIRSKMNYKFVNTVEKQLFSVIKSIKEGNANSNINPRFKDAD